MLYNRKKTNSELQIHNYMKLRIPARKVRLWTVSSNNYVGYVEPDVKPCVDDTVRGRSTSSFFSTLLETSHCYTLLLKNWNPLTD